MPITINDIKKLSPQVKALIVVGVVFLVGYLYYFYFLSDILNKKSELEKESQEIEEQLNKKQKIVKNFDQYKAEVSALQESYKVALQKLPDQREIPGLFHSVALMGRDAKVEFVLFEPRASVPQTLEQAEKISAKLKPSDKRQEEQEQAQAQKSAAKPAAPGDKKSASSQEPFYEEIPVKVTVVGSFQNIVSFFEKVAKLPRIVNISEISMGDRKEVKGRGQLLTASCVVKTYMFVDKKEQVNEKANEKK